MWWSSRLRSTKAESSSPYDGHHAEDEFGGLGQVPLEPGEWAPFEIDLKTHQRESTESPSIAYSKRPDLGTSGSRA
jgi:hypothetical protein